VSYFFVPAIPRDTKWRKKDQLFKPDMGQFLRLKRYLAVILRFALLQAANMEAHNRKRESVPQFTNVYEGCRRKSGLDF
jgi:hypothetical protein